MQPWHLLVIVVVLAGVGGVAFMLVRHQNGQSILPSGGGLDLADIGRKFGSAAGETGTAYRPGELPDDASDADITASLRRYGGL